MHFLCFDCWKKFIFFSNLPMVKVRLKNSTLILLSILANNSYIIFIIELCEVIELIKSKEEKRVEYEERKDKAQ